MNIDELESYDLGAAVKFNTELNPRLWNKDETLRPEVRQQLLRIASDFAQFLGVTDYELKDVTISGSNAAYTYTPHSDIDLHLVADLPKADHSEVYKELFDAKKYQYNDQHNITIGDYDVELYVQNANEPHISQGIYSVLQDKWIQVPRRRAPQVDDVSTRSKYETLSQHIAQAIESGDYEKISAMTDKIRKMRQAGLEQHGEFGPENLAFKILRTQGQIEKLYQAKNDAKDRMLSLDERKKKKKRSSKKRWGHFGGYWYPGTGYAGQDTPASQDAGDGGGGDGESVQENQQVNTDEKILQDFIKFCVAELKINHLPQVKLRRDPEWSRRHKTFGRYNDDTKTLEVAWGSRHIMDVLRTVAHELTHKHQHEREGERMGPDAGETGSPYENEANARAGVLMRDYGRLHPEYFTMGQVEELEEGWKEKVGAVAAAACIAGTPGCSTTGQAIKTTQDVGRTVQTAKNMTRAGVQDELSQELRNFIRAQGGDPGSQNLSTLYKLKKRLTNKSDATNESASGYIPTKKQARDPRYSMALTVDIKPGQVGKEANKLKLKTDRQGHPQIAQPSGLVEALTLELARFKADEDYSPDNPPGPESKPTMPQGTLRVDVSDVYDWYKLGQHISNLKGLGQHDFGAGPPSSIISFGDEDTEHKFINDLKKTGLDVTDIDPVDPKQPTGMKRVKTDPTYNVDEVIQAPVSKNRDAEEYYRFIIGKHRLGRPLTRQETEFVKMYKLYQKQNVAESQEQLDEVKMSPSALMQWAKSPEAQGIRSGFEAELIFRDTTNDDDDDTEMEPDYDYDERARSVQGVIDFFQSGDYGGLSQREENRLQEGLDNQYLEWMDERLYEVWENERDELIKEAWLREKPMTERVHDYLVDGMDMDDREADRIQAVGDAAPRFTKSSDQTAYTQANPDYATYLEAEEGAEAILEEDVEQTIEKQDGFYDEVLDEFRENFYIDDDSSFFQDVGLSYMSDIAAEFSLDWPYLTGGGGGNNGGSREWDEIGDSLNSAIDMPVKVSTGYHNATRREGQWIVEPDSSLSPDDREDFGLEIVSPPLPLLDALEKLQQVTDWANNPQEGNAYTNSSTGLHMGVSVPYKGGDVDYLKLILFLGDEYVLQSFGREANTYTKSAMKAFRENIRSGRADPAGALMLMKNNLIEFAQREIQKGVGTSKYTSAHIQNGYIEFRSAGGDWLAEESADPQKLSSTMLRYARAMQIAANPSEERREYAKKLYKLVAPEGDSQLALFSQYAAGELTAEQLKKKWAEKTIGTEKKQNQRWKLYQMADGGWQPVSGAEWNGYTEEQVKNAVWSKYGREALDSGEYKLINMGEQAWEVYRVDNGETLEIVKGKSRGEVADAVYDKYVDQGIGFNVRAYEDPATMTPRAKLAKRIAAKKPEPRQVANQATNERGVPYWEIYSIKDDWNVIHTFLSDTAADAKVDGANWLTSTGVEYPDRFAVRPKIKTAQVKDIAPDVAQNFTQPQQARASNGVPAWEIYERESGNVINTIFDHDQTSAWQQAQLYLRDIGAEQPNLFSLRPKMSA